MGRTNVRQMEENVVIDLYKNFTPYRGGDGSFILSGSYEPNGALLGYDCSIEIYLTGAPGDSVKIKIESDYKDDDEFRPVSAHLSAVDFLGREGPISFSQRIGYLDDEAVDVRYNIGYRQRSGELLNMLRDEITKKAAEETERLAEIAKERTLKGDPMKDGEYRRMLTESVLTHMFAVWEDSVTNRLDF